MLYKYKKKRENVRILFWKILETVEMKVLLLLNLEQKIDFFCL